MRIALLSTCAVTTPPTGYGGTELVVAELARELAQLGHAVTVYATADSRPEARRRALFPRPVWPPSDVAEVRHAAFAWRDIARGGFDVVHLNHAMHLPFTALVDVPAVLTVHHCRVDSLVEHYRAYPNVHYVAISHRQAELLPELPIARVIHHGVDPHAYPAGAGQGGYVAFLGRFAPEKGPHTAIDATVRAGVPLELAGAPHDRAYFERELAPRLARHPDLVRYVGELVHEPKTELLRHARAMLFPIDWEEPFGLVMIESMLVGTPVIAFPHGAAAEVVEDGVTGFIVRDLDEMAERIRQVDRLDRRACRQRALERFSSPRMAAGYAELYEELHDDRRAPRAHHQAHALHRHRPRPAAGTGGTP